MGQRHRRDNTVQNARAYTRARTQCKETFRNKSCTGGMAALSQCKLTGIMVSVFQFSYRCVLFSMLQGPVLSSLFVPVTGHQPPATSHQRGPRDAAPLQQSRAELQQHRGWRWVVKFFLSEQQIKRRRYISQKLNTKSFPEVSTSSSSRPLTLHNEKNSSCSTARCDACADSLSGVKPRRHP